MLKSFNKNMKKVFNYKSLLVLLLLIIGLSLRLYNIQYRTGFDADQEWLAYRAKDVLHGDLALLGPVTSIGNFSIGPGFIYLWSIFSYFTQENPISGAYLSVFLGILTYLAIFLFAKQFISSKVAYVLLFITTFSSVLIFWDQSPWAPSLFYLSQIIILAGAYVSNKNKLGIPILALGFVIGFQSHFGVFLSLLSVFIYFLFVRPPKPNIKTVLLTLTILFIGYLPNLLFDLFNNFTNLKRFVMIFKGDGSDYITGFGKIVNTLSYSISSILYPFSYNIFDKIVSKVILALLLVNGFRLLFDKKKKNLSLLLLISTIFPAIFFYLQQGKFSEYYLIMTIPPLIFLLGLSFEQIINKKLILILIFVFALSVNYKSWYSSRRSWSLGDKMDVTNKMIEIAGREDYGISINSMLGDRFGFEYVFDYFDVKADYPPKKDQEKIITVALPNGYNGIVGFKNYGGIGILWQGF